LKLTPGCRPGYRPPLRPLLQPPRLREINRNVTHPGRDWHWHWHWHWQPEPPSPSPSQAAAKPGQGPGPGPGPTRRTRTRRTRADSEASEGPHHWHDLGDHLAAWPRRSSPIMMPPGFRVPRATLQLGHGAINSESRRRPTPSGSHLRPTYRSRLEINYTTPSLVDSGKLHKC